jgi:3-methyladenine DNA glycosylase AlkD
MDVERVIKGLEARLRAVATPERAEHERRYLKSDLTFLGATVWQIEAAVKEIERDHGDADHRDLVALVEALWTARVHERRMAAVMALERFGRLLGVDDLPLIERLVRESRTWALVDGLAGDVLGELVQRDPDDVSLIMDRWATDTDFWVRRASLLAELRPIRRGATLDRFLTRADSMLDEKEFFIRKAIGWVLREAGKRRPDEVSAWLAPRTHRASGVTMREAVKYLPEADAARLMAAYRGRRAAGDASTATR